MFVQVEGRVLLGEPQPSNELVQTTSLGQWWDALNVTGTKLRLTASMRPPPAIHPVVAVSSYCQYCSLYLQYLLHP